MGINITVTHTDLNASQLAALLWDGIEMAQNNGGAHADIIIRRVSRGTNLFTVPKHVRIRQYVKDALEAFGSRSVDCGSQSDAWNDAVEEWCMAQVARVYKVTA